MADIDQRTTGGHFARFGEAAPRNGGGEHAGVHLNWRPVCVIPPDGPWVELKDIAELHELL